MIKTQSNLKNNTHEKQQNLILRPLAMAGYCPDITFVVLPDNMRFKA